MQKQVIKTLLDQFKNLELSEQQTEQIKGGDGKLSSNSPPEDQ